jgi:hypothetical protein
MADSQSTGMGDATATASPSLGISRDATFGGKKNLMRLRLPRWTAVTAATALTLATMLPQGAAAQVGPTCAFQNGFASLDGVLGQDIIGNCRDNEHFNPLNGNIEQVTNNGLLFWRKCDNTTAFTNGYVTWLNGPNGLQNRLAAGPLLDWEPIDSTAPPCLAAPPVVTQTVTAVAAQTPTPPPPPIQPPPPKPTPDPACPSTLVSVRNTVLFSLDRRGVNYMCADMYGAKLVGTDFSGANLVQANLQAADLTRANFTSARLTLAVLVTTTGSQVNFVSADLRGAKLSGSKLPAGDFRYADLSNADLSRVVLTGGDVRWADLRAADLSQADFTGANLTGAYLCGANTTGTIFTKAVGLSTSCS